MRDSFSVTFYESLMISPFVWGQNYVQALFGIQHLDITLNFENLARILSGDINGWIGAPKMVFFLAGNINNLTITVPAASAAALHLTFLTPPSDWSIPRLLHYPFYSINKTVAVRIKPIIVSSSSERLTKSQQMLKLDMRFQKDYI